MMRAAEAIVTFPCCSSSLHRLIRAFIMKRGEVNHIDVSVSFLKKDPFILPNPI